MITGDQDQAHQIGWRVAGLIADANLPLVDEDELVGASRYSAIGAAKARCCAPFDALIEKRRT